MKSLKIINGPEYVLEDEEALYLQKLIASGQSKFVSLSNGDLINISAIARIGELEKKGCWKGWYLNDEKTGFWRDGKFLHLEKEELEEIEYKDDPKYLNMSPVKLLK